MNKFYLKKIFDFLHKAMERFRVVNTVEFDWHVILIVFVLLNIISAGFAYSFFRKVNQPDSGIGTKNVPSVEATTFSRKTLRDALDIYKNREGQLENLKKSPPVSSDPSL